MIVRRYVEYGALVVVVSAVHLVWLGCGGGGGGGRGGASVAEADSPQLLARVSSLETTVTTARQEAAAANQRASDAKRIADDTFTLVRSYQLLGLDEAVKLGKEFSFHDVPTTGGTARVLQLNDMWLHIPNGALTACNVRGDRISGVEVESASGAINRDTAPESFCADDLRQVP